MFSGKKKSQLLEVFKGFQGLRKDSFSTSLPYYLLTGRKGCQAYTDGTATVVVALHPHTDGRVLVFPEINGDGQLTVKILNQLAYKNVDVQLARYTEEDYQKLNHALAEEKHSAISSIQLTPEDILDWNYPAHILDTKKVSELKGNNFSDIRTKFNKVAGRFEEIPLSDPKAIQKIRASILIWAGLTISVGKESHHDMTSFYHKLVELISQSPDSFNGFALSHKGEPAGFTIWEEAGDTANAIAGLSRRSIAGMSEYQTIKACRLLNNSGVQKYNLGGSETAGLDKYKLKFTPVDSLHLSSYNVSFISPSEQGIDRISLVNDDADTLNLKL